MSGYYKETLTIEELGRRNGISLDVDIELEHVYEPQTHEYPGDDYMELQGVIVTSYCSDTDSGNCICVPREASPEHFQRLDSIAAEHIDRMLANNEIEPSEEPW